MGVAEWSRTLPKAPETTRKIQILESKVNALCFMIISPRLVGGQVCLRFHPLLNFNHACSRQPG